MSTKTIAIRRYFIAGLLTLTGCTSITFDQTPIEYRAITVGMTEAEVIARLGRPVWRRGNLTRWQSSPSPDVELGSRVDVVFDRDGRVLSTKADTIRLRPPRDNPMPQETVLPSH
jgi:hypothetical protein